MDGSASELRKKIDDWYEKYRESKDSKTSTKDGEMKKVYQELKEELQQQRLDISNLKSQFEKLQQQQSPSVVRAPEDAVTTVSSVGSVGTCGNTSLPTVLDALDVTDLEFKEICPFSSKLRSSRGSSNSLPISFSQEANSSPPSQETSLFGVSGNDLSSLVNDRDD